MRDACLIEGKKKRKKLIVFEAVEITLFLDYNFWMRLVLVAKVR